MRRFLTNVCHACVMKHAQSVQSAFTLSVDTVGLITEHATSTHTPPSTRL